MSVFLPTMDFRRLVSRADIHYLRPAPKSFEGLPVGNGRMGTLVWTRNTALELQINRVDLFAQDSTGGSGSDDCGACAIVRIDFGRPVFRTRDGYREHLRLYEGRLIIEAEDIAVEVLCHSDRDILFIHVEDRRRRPLLPAIEVERPRPLDPSQRLHHRYACGFKRSPGKLSLFQTFSEREFHCRSEICITAFDTEQVIGSSGGSASHAVGLDDQDAHITSDYHQQARMLVKPRTGSYTVAIAADAGFGEEDECEIERRLDLAREAGFETLRGAHLRWWREFWGKSYIHLRSVDGTADFIERCYTYYLYVMASSSRGEYPPKFNGMIWSTRGFMREWGAQYWLFNEEAMYYPLAAANHVELSNPYFDMYGDMVPAGQVAARQRWGSEGVFIPETESFNGPEIMTECAARSLRAVNYGELPYADMPDDLRDLLTSKLPTSQLGQFISTGQRWTWIAQIVSGAGELGIQAWQRYECTGDIAWLEKRAYPFLKGAVEFYRSLPSLKCEADGCYHLYNTNVHESVWGVKDSIYDLAVLKTCIPITIRASLILQIDSDLRDLWRELLDQLTPYPTDGEDDAAFGLGPGTWAACREPAATEIMNVEQVWLYPAFFEDWTLLRGEEDIDRIAQKTYDKLPDRTLLERGVLIALHSRFPVMMSKLGRADDVEKLLPVYLGTSMREPPNGLSLWEGLEAMTAEHLGIASYGLQEALLQSCGPRPGEDPVIHVFPAWPESWQARFSLLARGGFMVSAAASAGEVEYVHITSNLGNLCTIENPWPSEALLFRENGESAELAGSRLQIATAAGESFVLVPAGVNPDELPAEVVFSDRLSEIWEMHLPIPGRESRITVGLEA